MGKARTDIPVLDVSSRFPLGFDDVVGLLDEVLQEHFRRGGDDEGGVVGAVAYVGVDVDDFLHAGHCVIVCQPLLWWSSESAIDGQGRLTVPVTSFEGPIGVLLYGIMVILRSKEYECS